MSQPPKKRARKEIDNKTKIKLINDYNTKPSSGPIIQEKAMQFAEELGCMDFKASNGWFDSWKYRYSVKSIQLCGDKAEVNQSTVTDNKDKLPSVIAGYKLDAIFNCDETGLFFRALPDRTLAAKGEDCSGTKTSKERMTVMLCCSALARKLSHW